MNDEDLNRSRADTCRVNTVSVSTACVQSSRVHTVAIAVPDSREAVEYPEDGYLLWPDESIMQWPDGQNIIY